MTNIGRRRVHTEKMDAFHGRREERVEQKERNAAARARFYAFKERVKMERTEQGQALEREAIALYRQYGFILPGPAKSFFRKLAIHLQWQDLMKVTK